MCKNLSFMGAIQILRRKKIDGILDTQKLIFINMFLEKKKRFVITATVGGAPIDSAAAVTYAKTFSNADLK